MRETGAYYVNCNRRFLLKYLSITGQAKGTDIEKYIPQAKGTTTLHSLVKNEHQGQFQDALVNPDQMTQEEVTEAQSWAITQALEVTYGTHFYTAGGQVHKQTDGGPQGLSTAVEASDLYMLQGFDCKYLRRLGELGIKVLLYSRYVDDITMAVPAINPGWWYCKESKTTHNRESKLQG